MSKLIDIKGFPICDCDIWLRLSWGNVLNQLFKVHGKIVVSDFVEEEILRWKSDPRFSKPATDFLAYKTKGDIIVIKHDVHIENEDKPLIEKQFRDFGLFCGFTNDPSEKKDKGEIASAIYADHFGITLMKSDDKYFAEYIQPVHFPDITIHNLNDTLRNIIGDHKERFAVMKKIEEINREIDNMKAKNTKTTAFSNFNNAKSNVVGIDKNSDLSIDEMIKILAQKMNTKM